MLAAHIAIIWTWSLSELLAVRTASYTRTRLVNVILLSITLSTLRDLWIYGYWTRTLHSVLNQVKCFWFLSFFLWISGIDFVVGKVHFYEFCLWLNQILKGCIYSDGNIQIK